VTQKTVTVRKNKDGTITVRVGNNVEHVSTESRAHGDIFDAVKYAIIAQGVYLSDVEVTELIQEATL
jgi:hypothetical protein